MRVFEIERPIIAYTFIVNAEGTNYDTLAAEVIADGGVIEQVADDLVTIKIGGANITLPLGFAVVLDGTGVGKVMAHSKFIEKYVVAEDLDTNTQDNTLVNRIVELEKQLTDITSLGSRLVAVETAIADLSKSNKTSKTKIESDRSNR